MSGEITKAVIDGARVTISTDCWPCLGTVENIRVSVTRRTWNGVVTLNRNVPVGPLREQMDTEIVRAVMEMAENIEQPNRGRGNGL
jgi:hypothetical protein